MNNFLKLMVVLLAIYTYCIYFLEGGNKMVIVNIIFLTFMAMFVVEAFSYLIPALIEEFKNMED